MKPSFPPTIGIVCPPSLAVWFFAFALVLLPAVGLYADSPATALHITNTGRDTEGLPTYQLDWDAVSNATYLVQSATNLTAANPWHTLDALTPTNGSGVLEIKGRSIPENSVAYFRLVLPTPRIVAVEPAIVAPGLPVDLHVLGQCFPTNVELRIKNLPMSGTLYQSSDTLVQPGFVPDVAGDYQVSLVFSGQVFSSFTVVCADPVANPELVLQGPPELPPAAPNSERWAAELEKLAKASSPKLNAMFAASPPVEPPASPSATITGHAGEPLEISWETMELKAGMAAPPGGGSADPLSESGRMNFYTCWPSKWQGPPLNARAGVVGGITGGVVAGIVVGKVIAANRGDRDSKEGVVLAFSGEVSDQVVDLIIPGRELDFVWARTYNSRIGRSTAPNGWTFSYDLNIQPLGGDILINNGTGREDRFKPDTNGVYTCPEFFSEGTFSNTTFTLTFADTGRWVFNPTDDPTAAGKLHQIITRNGNTMTLGYDSSGQLAQIVDDLGRTNTLAYDSSGRLSGVTDFSGRTVSYEYDGHGDLVACVSPPVLGTPNGNDFPGGKTNRYTYTSGYPLALDRQNHLLLACVDALGQTTAQFTYGLSAADPANYLRCLAAQEGSNPPSCYRWSLFSAPAGSRAILSCIVNDPVGNVTECDFDARGRCVAEREFTGRATPGLPVTDTVNRPKNKLRQTDPDYYQTQWTWNNDSLSTAEISPGGQQVRCVYQSDFDPATPARKRADCRVVRELASSPVDLDGDGVAETSERVSRFEYDPRFGSPPLAKQDDPEFKSLFEKIDKPIRKTAALSAIGSIPIVGGVLRGASDLSAPSTRWQKVDNSETPVQGSRTRLDQLESRLNNLGLLSRSSNGGINEKTPDTFLQSKADKVSGAMNGNFAGFVTSATDPRGNVATGEYDANGNLSKIIYNSIDAKVGIGIDRPTSAFAYDPHGQLTAITNAPDANGRRRVDTFAYSQGQLTQCVLDAGAGGLTLTSAFEYDTRGNLTRYVDPRTNDWLFTYNALDQCVRAQSPPNISARCATDFFYDGNDNLVACATQLRDAADNLLATPVDRATYDSLHQLTELALAMDATRALTNRFVYDASGQCVQALGPDAVSGADPHQTMTCAYDERGLLFREISAPGSPLQSTTQCDYDSNRRPTRVSAGLEGTPSVTTLEYDGFVGNAATGGWTGVAVKTTSKGTLFRQNSCAAIKTEGNENGYKYVLDTSIDSSFSQPAVAAKISPVLDKVKGFTRLSRVTDPMGNVTTFNFDANDNLKVVRHFGETNDVAGSAGNVRLAESRFEYDGLDRCFRTHALFFNPATQSPVGNGDAVSSCVLAPNGACLSVTDSLGRTTGFGYDTAGRPASVTDARGHISVSYRDQLGNPTAITRTELPDGGGSPQVFTTAYAYDHLNRCVSASDNVGNTATCAYDSLGRVVRETNPNGNDTTYSYDLLGNCLATADYDGSSSSLKPIVLRSCSSTYDTSSRCLSSTDPKGNLTTYAYDSLGHCTTVVNADGTRIQKAWLPSNFRTIATDPNGTTVTNSYDLCDRLIHRDIAASTVTAATTTFETFAYDGCDRLVRADNDVSSLSFSYNSLGDCTGGSQDGLAQSATYDSKGNQLSLTYPGGRVVSYAYDVLDQVTNVSTTANGVSHPQLARFAYAGPGRLAGIARDNGINTRITWNGLVNPANSPGDYGWQEVNRVRDGTVASPSLVCDVTATYSRTQSKLTRADAGRSSLTLTYDALEQLIEASDSVSPRDTMYALDAAGNRSHVITNSVLMTPDYALSSVLPPGDFFMNRYTTTPFGDQSYDPNGNLVVRASAASLTLYLYDYADRLVAVQAVVDGGTGTPVTNTLASFTYDALGHRLSKTTYSGVPAAPLTTQYVNDVVTYKDGEDSVSHTRPGNHKPGKMRILEERVGTSASRTYCEMTAFTATGESQYYHYDDLGNVLALTDASGNVLERYAYDDYGQPQFLSANGAPLVDSTGSPVTASPLGNPFLFHGMEWDGETGLLGDGGGNYFDPPTGSAVRGKVKVVKDMGNGRAFEGNNPWTGGGALKASDGKKHFEVTAK